MATKAEQQKLNRDAVAAYVTARAGSTAAEVKGALEGGVTSRDGDPLTGGQIDGFLRSLVDDGHLIRDGDRYYRGGDA